MRKIFAVILFIFLSSIFVLSQSKPSKTAEWKVFQPKGEEYSLESPGEFLNIYSDYEENNQRFSMELNGRFFFIFSENLKTISPDKTIINFINSLNTKSGEFKVSGLNGKYYSAKLNDDYFHKILIINTRNKIYAFHTASETENDALIDRFFYSIRMDRTLVGENASIEKPEFISEPYGIAACNAGNADVPTINIISDQPNLNNTRLKLISKPRAIYTDFARFFNIQGTVTLRVTFISNGEIGEVTSVNKLPFGLTSNSIEAARKMRFEPMKKDGAATDSVKTVQYSFTIY